MGIHPVEFGVVDVESTSVENDASERLLRLGNLGFAKPLGSKLKVLLPLLREFRKLGSTRTSATSRGYEPKPSFKNRSKGGDVRTRQLPAFEEYAQTPRLLQPEEPQSYLLAPQDPGAVRGQNEAISSDFF